MEKAYSTKGSDIRQKIPLGYSKVKNPQKMKATLTNNNTTTPPPLLLLLLLPGFVGTKLEAVL